MRGDWLQLRIVYVLLFAASLCSLLCLVVAHLPFFDPRKLLQGKYVFVGLKVKSNEVFSEGGGEAKKRGSMMKSGNTHASNTEATGFLPGIHKIKVYMCLH